MKTVMLILMVLSLSGCAALRAGTIFDGTICAFASERDAMQRLHGIVALLPEGQDKQRAQAALVLSGISADAMCVVARELEGRLARGTTR